MERDKHKKWLTVVDSSVAQVQFIEASAYAFEETRIRKSCAFS